ncbi:metallophosphoesterase [Paenibacillus athensensis]|uniref:Phosphohydrolase n=1 Tax=Paenibacillus athensensis TaxID=1967502 RepID=A0A4Y8PYJ9_9BACL|nr:metallophosphoesterase [Paenibacillus athensensis]MCD1259916.1 metallophosphoesterase [Paenibacillus athensensis]
MSRRSFVRWLLLVGAALIGLSFGLTRWLIKLTDRMTVSQAAPSPSAGVAPEPEASARPVTGEPLFSYFILSDLHVTPVDRQTTDKLRLALDDIQAFAGPVDAIMATGDLTDTGTQRDYDQLRAVLDEYKQLPPFHANMGNHDYYTIWINKNNAWQQSAKPNGKSDALSREQFKNFMGYERLYNEYTANDHSILLLSQEAYVQEMPEVGEGAWYSDAQMAWLKERLETLYKPGRPLFVMIHQPLPPMGSDGGSHQLIRAKEFRALLRPYSNIFVFCGHRHMDFDNGTPHYVQETFHFFHNSSVSRPLNRQEQAEAKKKSQGLYVQVFENRVVVKGREFTSRTFLDDASWTVPLKQA